MDEKQEFAQNKQYMSKFSSRSFTTIEAHNSDVEASPFNGNSQPLYVLLNSITEQALMEPQGFENEVSKYLTYLKSGLSAFKP